MKYTLIIGFTGHRDMVLRDNSILKPFEGVDHIWIHGGAKAGFDFQIQTYIDDHAIAHRIYLPNYDKFKNRPKYAPLARDEQIVKDCDLLVALWDGRTNGGTAYTVNYAKMLRKPVINLYSEKDYIKVG